MADQLITGTTLIEDIRKTAVAGTIWSCSGENFHGANPDTDNIDYQGSGEVHIGADDIQMFAPVFLPHGATITAVTCFGDAAASAETWFLFRAPIITTAQETVATAVFNTEDSTITNAIVDNANYRYYITTSSMDTGDEIYGAKIVYTL